MRQIIIFLALLANLFFIDFSVAIAGPDTAGKTSLVYQEAFANDKPLKVDDTLIVGETLTTKSGARLHARMIDDTVLMLGENARFEIDELAFDNNSTSAKAHFKILSGAFRMISGELTKRPDNQVTLTPPIATIGIRGTDFWGIVKEDSLSIALLDDSEIVVILPTGPITMNAPMTILKFNRGDIRPSLDILTEQALAEAVKTVTLPN